MQNKIGERDWINRVVLLASVKSMMLEPFQLRAGDFLASLLAHELKTLSQETACSTARVVNRFTDLWFDHAHHRPDNFARRKELPAVRALLTDLQQQTPLH